MMKIIGIKTNKGYYIKHDTSYRADYLGDHLINNEKPTVTFDSKWFFTQEEPVKVQIYKSQSNTNYRYELIDKTMVSEKIPLMLEKDKVESDDEYTYWVDEFKHLSSLYSLQSDEQPDILVDVEFEYTTVTELNIDEIKEPNKFSYPVQRTQWESDGLANITNSSVQHQLIDRIIFPDILIHETPCELSSEQVYKIVRQYIKQHINYDVAKITSDYDFCFTVQKIIALVDPYTHTTEIFKNNGRSYKTPRYNKRYVSARTVEVFEMTYSPKNYGKYTPIESIRADNEDELKDKVDALCKSIIDMINEPLVDCPHCKGQGVILKED